MAHMLARGSIRRKHHIMDLKNQNMNNMYMVFILPRWKKSKFSWVLWLSIVLCVQLKLESWSSVVNVSQAHAKPEEA
jgi:hypothetical protein